MNMVFRRCAVAVATASLLGACTGDESEPIVQAPPPPTPAPEWSAPVVVSVGGCPIESRDGRLLYTASGPAGTNGLDIWAARRDGSTNVYDSRTKLGDPVSLDTVNDLCPTPVMGDYLFFVSTRDGADKCGEPGPVPGLTGADLFITRYAITRADAPVTALTLQSNGPAQRLACYPNGPNNKGMNLSPSLLTTADGSFLFFSSEHNGVNFTGSQDIYASEMRPDGTYGPGVPVAGLNTSFEDQQPNVSRDGLTIVFASNRDGNMDIFMATRATLTDAWSTPRNLSVQFSFVSAASAETRPSISWDQKRLYYGADGSVYLSHKAPTN